MTKTKKVLYLAAAIVVVAVTVVALASGRGKEKNVAENYQPIVGAKASSYEPVVGALEIGVNDNLIGSEKAPLKIFVYEDYSNIYTADLAETLNKLKLEFDDKFVIISRPYALAGSSLSREAALATICAKDLGKKWEEMRIALLTATKNGTLQSGGLSLVAADIDINEEEFNACLTNEEKSVKLDAVMSDAEKSLVLGAPTMFVGDEMILGARPYSDFVDSNGDAIEGLKTVVERKISETVNK
jgi:protein-disulfide isomerase